MLLLTPQSTPCKHPVILLQDVNFMDLHSLVEFIYHGEVNVHQKSLQSFLKTAEVLRVSGLTQQQAEDTHSVSTVAPRCTSLADYFPLFCCRCRCVALGTDTEFGKCGHTHAAQLTSTSWFVVAR